MAKDPRSGSISECAALSQRTDAPAVDRSGEGRRRDRCDGRTVNALQIPDGPGCI